MSCTSAMSPSVNATRSSNEILRVSGGRGARLVVAEDVGQMNLEPAQAVRPQRLGLVEQQQPARQLHVRGRGTAYVIAQMRQVWWDNIGAPAEVNVVREINWPVLKLHSEQCEKAEW